MAVIASTHAPGDVVPALIPGPLAQAITLGTPVQNTNLYNAMLQVGLVISTATSATVTVGTAPTSAGATSAAVTQINTFTLASVTYFALNVYVPYGYFVVLNSTGTFTVTTATGLWYPAG